MDEVVLYAPVITGTPSVNFTKIAEATWRATIVNNEAAETGDYEILLSATSVLPPGLALYDYATVTIIKKVKPEIWGIDPDNGFAGENLTDVTITGANFIEPVEVSLLKVFGILIEGENVFVMNPSTIICDFSIPFTAPLHDDYAVMVHNGCDQGTFEYLFEIKCPLPSLTGGFPTQGKAGEIVFDVDIYGTNFYSGHLKDAVLKMAGEPDVPGSYISIKSPTHLTCDFVIPPGSAAGIYDLEVTNGCGEIVTALASFEITD